MINYREFLLVEGFISEAETGIRKSKISPDLDNLMENKWMLATIKREYDKDHDGAWSKHDEKFEEEKAKIKDKYRDKDGNLPKDTTKIAEEIAEKQKEMRKAFVKDVVSKDPKYKEEVNDYYKKQDRFEELGKKLNKVGFEKFKKENAKEYDELLDLQADHMNPIRISAKPGGVVQISTTNMERGGDEGKPGHVDLPAEVGSDAFRRKVKQHIDKNGKPKGVIMDLRTNTGGQQEIAKSMTDFFVDDDNYEIESQKFNYGPRIWKDDPDGLEKYKKVAWDPQVMEHLDSLDKEGQKKYWEESKKKGYFELPNKRKNQVDPKYRLTNVPVVLQTSTKTFSAGEFASDTIKNLNPKVVHIGTNSGGGANQTFGGLEPDGYNEDGPYWDNGKKSGTEKAKLIAKAFKDTYHDADVGQKIHDDIIKKVESGDIKDNMSSEEVAKITKESAIATSNDNHANVFVEKNGSVFPLVPQVRSDRVIVDPKTRKPIMKDGKPVYKGNWEQSGVGAADTGPFVETDSNTATRDALEILYNKTGQKDLAKKLKENPEEFGLRKDGKDGVFDDSMDSHKSYFAHKHLSGEDGEFSQRQADQLEKSKETAKETAKTGVLQALEKKEKEFTEKGAGDEGPSKEDVGARKLLAGFDKDTAQRIRDMKVTIAMPGGKKKTIQTETLMDFVPIDDNDPTEAAMIRAQAMQYARINALRKKNGLEELMPFEEWKKLNLELAKDNKEYQARLKAKTLRKMKAVRARAKATESQVSNFEQFLVEEDNDRAFNEIFNKHYITNS